MTIPNSVTSIGQDAFDGCSSLISVISEIENPFIIDYGDVFGYVPLKAQLTVPYGTKAAYQSTAGWNRFTNIVESRKNYGKCGDNVYYTYDVDTHALTISGEGAIWSNFAPEPEVAPWAGLALKTNNLKDIQSVIIESGVISISRYCFHDFLGLTSVTIANSVTTIGESAFKNCSSLSSITIPNSVTSIDDDAFDDTAWYKNQPNGLVYAGKVAYKYQGNMPADTHITLQDGTLGIAAKAFASCSGLTSVTIPYSLTSINGGAFLNCNGLTTVISGIEDPYGIENSVFSNIPTDAWLIVPKGTKTKYQATPSWNTFQNIRENIAGDANLDGVVNKADVNALIDYIMGEDVEDMNEYMADVNRDGIVNVADVTALTTLVNMYTEQSSRTFTANGVSFKMVRVDGGTFTMGATSEQGDEAKSNEKPTHQVTLSSYYMGETEVTQELWQAVMGSNPSEFSGGQRPVETVSWEDCQEFITKLNTLTGQNFRLPTEAEWEFAARGGNKSLGCKYAGSGIAGCVAWTQDNSSEMTHNVALMLPNELGLYDMSGNVWEWCQDWYAKYGSSSQTDPKGASSGDMRVFRGGSWYYGAALSRVSRRGTGDPTSTGSALGLRLAL